MPHLSANAATLSYSMMDRSRCRLTNQSLEDLERLYIDELNDAYDFEYQLLDALPKMVAAARSSELAEAFRDHRHETEKQIRRLDKVFASMGRNPTRRTSKAMKALLVEGECCIEAKGDDGAVDAALISAVQRVENYEMAVYKTLRIYAEELGQRQHAALLQETLEEEGAANDRLTRLTESDVDGGDR